MIGKIIRKQRILSGWRAGEFAKKIGVNANTVTRWEKRRGTPSIAKIIEIESLFNMEHGSLLSLLEVAENGTDKTVFVVFSPAINYDEPLKELDTICRNIIKRYPSYVIFSPQNAFSFYPKNWDSNWAFKSCKTVLLYLADEVWTFGSWQDSEECCLQVNFAKLCGLDIIHNPKI